MWVGADVVIALSIVAAAAATATAVINIPVVLNLMLMFANRFQTATPERLLCQPDRDSDWTRTGRRQPKRVFSLQQRQQ